MISGRMTSCNEKCRRRNDERNSERPTTVISSHTHTFLRTPLDVPYKETYIGQPSASKSANVQTTTPFVRRTATRCRPFQPPSDIDFEAVFNPTLLSNACGFSSRYLLPLPAGASSFSFRCKSQSFSGTKTSSSSTGCEAQDE